MSEIDGRTVGKAENEILLGVLDLVERDPALTQRSVAKELGIALGLANAYLKRCIQKGLVKVGEAPARRYAYYLTPQGFSEKSRLTASYFAYSFSFFRQARNQFDEIFAAAARQGQRRLALIGDGDLCEIATLVAGKHPVEILGVIASSHDPSGLAPAIRALGEVDAVAIAATSYSREMYEAVAKSFPRECIHIPELLRVRMPLSSGAAQ